MGRRRSTQRGTVIIGVGVSAVTLVGFLGLALDVSHLEWTKIRAQTAADNAALGALWEKKTIGSTAATVLAAGRNDSSLNGFSHNGNDVVVTINNPPSTGTYAGNFNAVEAIIQRNVGTFFMGILGSENAQVRARAVSLLSGSSSANGGCIYALNPTATRAISIGGSQQTYFSCDGYAKSTSTSAFYMEGSSTLYLKNESRIRTVGGYQLTGQTTVRDFEDNALENPVTTADFDDPLAAVVEPSGESLVLRSATWVNYDSNAPPANNTIQPGVYCGGMRVGSTGSATFTFAPGVYVIGGGGLWLNSQARITGTGVTIYNTSGARSGKAGCTAAFGGITIDGQASVTFNAPTSGNLRGIVIMQDRSITSTLETKVVGGSGTVINGAIYTKNSPILFSGNNTSSGYLILVGDKITITGNSKVNADYSSLEGGSPIMGSTAALSLVD